MIGITRKWVRQERAAPKGFNARATQALLNLSNSKLNCMRNRVVHKDGFRPTQGEAYPLVTEVYGSLFWISREFDLKVDDLHLNESYEDATRAVFALRSLQGEQRH